MQLKHAFYTSGDKADELFLNVVMEYMSAAPPREKGRNLDRTGKARQAYLELILVENAKIRRQTVVRSSGVACSVVTARIAETTCSFDRVCYDLHNVRR